MRALPVFLATLAGANPLPATLPGHASLSLALSPARVISGGTFSGTVTLAGAAPAGGSPVLLTAPAGVTIQGTGLQIGAVSGVKVTVPAGQTTATFHGFVAGVASQTTATIRATSLNDVATATLTIDPASIHSFTIAPASITGGKSGTATVTLNGAAAAGTGTTVLLSDVRQAASRAGTSNNLQQMAVAPQNSAAALPALPAGTVSLPASVLVPPGASSVTFTLATSPVASAGSALVDATVGNFGLLASVVVVPPVPASLTLSPATVGAGGSTTGTVVLTGPAASGGFPVPLSSSTTFATIPKLVTVPAGADRASFSVGTPPPAGPSSGTTFSVGATYPGGPISATITAGASTGSVLAAPTPGISDGTSNTIQLGGRPTATLTILPPPPAAAIGSFTIRPLNVTGGQNTILQLSLASGITTTQSVTLTSDHPQLVQVPASILITPPNSVGVTLHTSPVIASTAVTITASCGTQQIPLTITLVP